MITITTSWWRRSCLHLLVLWVVRPTFKDSGVRNSFIWTPPCTVSVLALQLTVKGLDANNAVIPFGKHCPIWMMSVL
ncbi:hypothetical protein [Ureibacillus sp. FSL K6-3587]|uniref:hypothetical protein n=1 Tax=unclassified Ureibacillus TaxID=2638520 RepID=UPI0031589187